MPDRFRPGDEICVSAADYNALAAALEQDYDLTATGGLRLQRGPAGRALALPRDPCLYATLSGSASPYSWTQALPQPGGTFGTGSRTGTTNAHEVNSAASLAGKVVRICPGYPGDWRFYYRTRATSCATIGVHVTGCGSLNLAGLQITFTKTGSTSVVVTTDSSGNATALLGDPGTWTYTTSKARFGAVTGSNGYVCSGTQYSLALAMIGHEATGYHCTNLCADPTASTLTFSDGVNPALTLTYGAGSPGAAGWIACATRTATGPALRNCASGTTGTVATAYAFDGSKLVMYQPVMDTNSDGVMDRLCTGITCSQLMQILNGLLFPGSTGCSSFDLFNGQIQASVLQPSATATNCTAGSMAFQAAFTTESSAATLVSWASIYGASASKTFTISE
jgi:hypothetical protein